jgi:K+-sensing histidine kinase KdpD
MRCLVAVNEKQRIFGPNRVLFYFSYILQTIKPSRLSMTKCETLNVINAGRAFRGNRSDRFRKGNEVSTLEERRQIRDLTASLPGFSAEAPSNRRYAPWKGLVGANAPQLVAALALVGVATVALVVINYFVQLDFVPLIYMVPVVIAATQWGILAAIVAAVAGAVAADFFFYPPLYSLSLSDPQDAIDLTLFLLVAIITGNLAARLKREAETTKRRAKEINELYSFSQRLATCLTARDLIFAVQDYLSNTLGYRTILVASPKEERGAQWDGSTVPREVRQEAAKQIASGSSHASMIVDPNTSKVWLVRPMAPEILGYSAIVSELPGGAGEQGVAKRVEALLEEATTTLKHLKVKESIEEATVEYRTEALRDALIGSVSHELRTPLASILGSCSVLDQMPAILDDRKSHDLIEAIHDQASELDSEIRDLLDATRINAQGIRPRLTWTDPTDIVNAAVKQKARRLASHWVTLDLQRDVPLIHVDSVLVEQAIGQILENAAKYSPAGTGIRVSSRRCEDGNVVLSVSDQGSGLTADEKGQLGKSSFRGKRQPVGGAGSGLGLWIASTFVSANGGTLCADSRGANLGTTISLRFPAAPENAPAPSDAIDD